jgi:hypothetical protein
MNQDGSDAAIMLDLARNRKMQIQKTEEHNSDEEGYRTPCLFNADDVRVRWTRQQDYELVGWK